MKKNDEETKKRVCLGLLTHPHLGFADLQSAAGKNAVARLGLTTPRFSLRKDGIFTFSAF